MDSWEDDTKNQSSFKIWAHVEQYSQNRDQPHRVTRFQALPKYCLTLSLSKYSQILLGLSEREVKLYRYLLLFNGGKAEQSCAFPVDYHQTTGCQPML